MATLGTVPLLVGTKYRWQRLLTKDGATWDLSAATVNFWWRKPDGTKFSQAAVGDVTGLTTYSDTAPQLDRPGNGWTFSIEVIGFGFVIVPVAFNVINAP